MNIVNSEGDIFFEDLAPEDQEQFLEELFSELRSPKNDSVTQLWRTAAVAVAALVAAAAVSPTFTISFAVLAALAILPLIFLIPIVVQRARMTDERHRLAEAVSILVGLPQASYQVDVREKIKELIRGESLESRKSDISGLVQKTKQKLKDKGIEAQDADIELDILRIERAEIDVAIRTLKQAHRGSKGDAEIGARE